jgi:hypothetical protein
VDLGSLVALQDKWEAWPEDSNPGYLSQSKDNDINSIEADPLLDDDYVPHNSDLKRDDNIWIGGIQPASTGGGFFVQGG